MEEERALSGFAAFPVNRNQNPNDNTENSVNANSTSRGINRRGTRNPDMSASASRNGPPPMVRRNTMTMDAPSTRRSFKDDEGFGEEEDDQRPLGLGTKTAAQAKRESAAAFDEYNTKSLNPLGGFEMPPSTSIRKSVAGMGSSSAGSPSGSMKTASAMEESSFRQKRIREAGDDLMNAQVESEGDDDEDEDGDFFVEQLESEGSDDDDDDMNRTNAQDEPIDCEDPEAFLKNLEAERKAAIRRLKAVQEELRFRDFNSLGRRYKLAGIMDPSLLGETEIPHNWLAVGRYYAVFVSAFALLHVIAAFLATVKTTKDAGNYLFYLTTIVAIVDFLFRLVTIAPRTSFIGVAYDFIVLVTSVLVMADVQKKYAIFFALFRALRVFRFLLLFEAFETCRDMFLVHRTITKSFRPLMVVAAIFVVSLMLFSTAVWVLEQSGFDLTDKRRLHQCTSQEACSDRISPFQSIPNSMWLIVSAMSTVGLGDVVPNNTIARVFTGIAIIAGVFMIAFPSMILVGNLQAVRKAYFLSVERRHMRLQVQAVSFLSRRDQEAARKEQKAALIERAAENELTYSANKSPQLNPLMARSGSPSQGTGRNESPGPRDGSRPTSGNFSRRGSRRGSADGSMPPPIMLVSPTDTNPLAKPSESKGSGLHHTPLLSKGHQSGRFVSSPDAMASAGSLHNLLSPRSGHGAESLGRQASNLSPQPQRAPSSANLTSKPSNLKRTLSHREGSQATLSRQKSSLQQAMMTQLAEDGSGMGIQNEALNSLASAFSVANRSGRIAAAGGSMKDFLAIGAMAKANGAAGLEGMSSGTFEDPFQPEPLEQGSGIMFCGETLLVESQRAALDAIRQVTIPGGGFGLQPGVATMPFLPTKASGAAALGNPGVMLSEDMLLYYSPVCKLMVDTEAPKASNNNDSGPESPTTAFKAKSVPTAGGQNTNPMPLVSNVVLLNGDNAMFTLTLIVDDTFARTVATDTMVEALDAQEHEGNANQDPTACGDILARALPMKGLEISVVSGLPSNMALLRRSDSAEITNNQLPLVFVVRQVSRYGVPTPEELEYAEEDDEDEGREGDVTSQGERQTLLPIVGTGKNKGGGIKVDPREVTSAIARDIASLQLRLLFRQSDQAGCSWRQNTIVNRSMLSHAELIRELRAISVNVAPSLYWPKEMQKLAAKSVREKRSNVAFVKLEHIPIFVDKMLEHIVTYQLKEHTKHIAVPEGERRGAGRSADNTTIVITNRSEIQKQVADLFTYHCRELFRDEIPNVIQSAIFAESLVGPNDKLLEVDIDFLRHGSWPLGSLAVEFAFSSPVSERLSFVNHRNTPGVVGATLPIKPKLANKSLTQRVSTFISEENFEASIRHATGDDANAFLDNLFRRQHTEMNQSGATDVNIGFEMYSTSVLSNNNNKDPIAAQDEKYNRVRRQEYHKQLMMSVNEAAAGKKELPSHLVDGGSGLDFDRMNKTAASAATSSQGKGGLHAVTSDQFAFSSNGDMPPDALLRMQELLGLGDRKAAEAAQAARPTSTEGTPAPQSPAKRLVSYGTGSTPAAIAAAKAKKEKEEAEYFDKILNKGKKAQEVFLDRKRVLVEAQEKSKNEKAAAAKIAKNAKTKSGASEWADGFKKFFNGHQFATSSHTVKVNNDEGSPRRKR